MGIQTLLKPLWLRSNDRGGGVDICAHYLFANAIDKNQSINYCVIGFLAACLVYLNLVFLNVALLIALAIAFACVGLAKAALQIYQSIDAQISTLIDAKIETEQCSSDCVESLSVLPVYYSQFAFRPSISVRIQSPTLYPRFSATPWLHRA